MQHHTAWLLALCGLATLATCERRRYSTWMLDSIKERKQGVVSSGASSSYLETGILSIALEAAIKQYPDLRDQYAPYLTDVLDAGTPGLANATYVATRPLDRFSIANAVRGASQADIVSISPTVAAASNAISESLSLQIRNPEGGLWYYVYPQWSYLDGMFSVLPFMASQPQPNYTDISLQMTLLYEHCFQKNTSLVVHGYDYSRKAVWADKDTGASPYVWGRSVGWFVAGLVQTWESLNCPVGKREAESVCKQLQEMTTQLATSLVRYADPETGAWWQLTTFPGRSGNYLESSSTALFMFSMLKGKRLGMLSDSKVDFRKAALKAYGYTTRNFVVDTGNGTIGYNKTVAVCSLNSTASYEYYTNQPLLPNSLLGESAFILASLEVERC
ncbi:cell wall glycosyl hydrolase [Colletotrichum tofieldiae]|uniref:Cell wall glycosyl hydrolase (Glycosyl Hydrolase Family 88) n=1 Tax=Colletotrichum tofieldiae TaxID=708197 RepID=A0A161YJI1_9PEZI|nr:cell wall glycosyl hydrolase (glycosyl Hydrolase Family 88) [Colletotrichum tofieldiae]GKT64964.1 cell wall glycosyl hydrolase [Colletotrichum tofieldiae]GKT74935.1 cell wall glycosyl hydrolase [Colletotrichum tofieldiae]GKT92146.1 cell wall glycosyl hydrolase [Colletotrichum tofieldiae]